MTLFPEALKRWPGVDYTGLRLDLVTRADSTFDSGEG